MNVRGAGDIFFSHQVWGIQTRERKPEVWAWSVTQTCFCPRKMVASGGVAFGWVQKAKLRPGGFWLVGQAPSNMWALSRLAATRTGQGEPRTCHIDTGEVIAEIVGRSLKHDSFCELQKCRLRARADYEFNSSMAARALLCTPQMACL